MNRIVFLIATWVFFGAELGLKDSFMLGESDVAPIFFISLLVFVAMHAPLSAALWSGLALGLLYDVTSPRSSPDATEKIVLIGPHAIGALIAAYAVHTSRTLVVRQNPVTFGFLAFLASMLMHVTASVFFEIRSMYDPMLVFHASGELASRFGRSVYTAVISLPLGWLLQWFAPVFGFPQASSKRRVSRGR